MKQIRVLIIACYIVDTISNCLIIVLELKQYNELLKCRDFDMSGFDHRDFYLSGFYTRL